MSANKFMKYRKSDKSDANMPPKNNSDDMAKEDRVRLVLETLVESEFAVPATVLYRNLKLRGATFERRSVINYLNELEEDGLAIKIDAEALDDGDFKEIPTNERGYWMATEAGQELLE